MSGLAAITSLSNEREAEYRKVYNRLKEKFGVQNSFNRAEIFEAFSSHSGYARRTYTGKIKEGITLTELELSMICDNGFSHFGGSSIIRSDRSFTVVIYTD